MTKRTAIILTSGCSFTQYRWPTWANYLKAWSTKGRPHRVVNVGEAGIDNSIITYRMVDYLNGNMPIGRFELKYYPIHVKKVCVMWTGYERYCPQYKDIVTHTDIKYVGKHFHPNERLRNLAMCIDTINLLCQSKNIKCFSFFYYQLSDEEKKYLDNMTVGPWHINYTSLSRYRRNNQPVFGNDLHPTPLDQWIFARDIVAPTIGLHNKKRRFTPKFVHDHERLVRAGDIHPGLSDYVQSDKPAHITEHMDPFASDILNIHDEWYAKSAALQSTRSAVSNMHDPINRNAEENWFNSIINRIRKF